MNRKRFLATALAAVIICGGTTLPLGVCEMNAAALDFIQYSDKASDTEGVKAFVSRMYDVCLGREPDELGLNGWTDQLVNREATGCSVAYGFVFSQEFINMDPSNSEFVDCMYEAFFGREADSEGFEYWVDFLDNGADKEDVFAGFANSQEFSNLCKKYGVVRGYYVQDRDFNQTAKVNLFVDRLYNIILDRECDEGGMAGWTIKLMNKEESGCSVAYGFVFSPEFLNRHACNECYVEALYEAFLGRASDSEGKASWVGKLNDGASREEVFAGFAGSIEFAGICADYGIDAGSIEGISGSTHQEGTCTICSSSEDGNATTPSAEGNTGNGSSSGSSNGNSGSTSSGNSANTSNDSDTDNSTPEPTPSVSPERKKVRVEDLKIPSKKYNEVEAIDDYTFDFPSSGSGFYRVKNSDGSCECYLLDENGNIVIGKATVIITNDNNGDEVMECYIDEETGEVYNGWNELNGKEYFFNDYGEYLRNYYVTKNGKIVFLNSYGQVVYGWYEGPSGVYYADPDTGELATGLTCINDSYFYFDEWYKVQTGWIQIDGYTYYFDPTNYMMYYNQKTIDGKNYYFDEEGRMVKKSVVSICRTVSNAVMYDYYYYGEDGSMQFGWVNDEGDWYLYNNETGKREFGWFQKDDHWFYLDADEGGAASKGWMVISNNRYYFDKDGCGMQIGWLQDGDNWYYLDLENGFMCINKWIQGSNQEDWYYVGSDGIMCRNEWVQGSNQEDRYYVGSDGIMCRNEWVQDENQEDWYYFGSNGVMRRNEWVQGSNQEDWYYVGSDGIMCRNEWVQGSNQEDWYYVGSDGIMCRNEWVQGSNQEDRYYVGSDGVMCKNKWVQDENQEDWYYVGSDGKMLRNTYIVEDGKTYNFDENGKMLKE